MGRLLEVQDGTLASAQYYRLFFKKVDAAEKSRTRAALLRYCERDTLAQVRRPSSGSVAVRAAERTGPPA